MAELDGTLLTLEQAKRAVRLEHLEDDAQLSDMISRVEASLQSFIGVPITAASFTEYHDGGGSRLFLRRFPVSSVTQVTDTLATTGDATDDEVVPSDEYRVNSRTGMVTRTTTHGRPKNWKTGIQRFKVEFDAGLDAHEDWGVYVQEELRGSVLDAVVWLYENPDAALRSEDEVGLSREVLTDAIPPRIREVWGAYQPIAF